MKRAARAVQRRRAADLVDWAGLNLSSAQRAEKANGLLPMMPSNERAVRRALEDAGVGFTEEGGILPTRLDAASAEGGPPTD